MATIDNNKKLLYLVKKGDISSITLGPKSTIRDVALNDGTKWLRVEALSDNVITDENQDTGLPTLTQKLQFELNNRLAADGGVNIFPTVNPEVLNLNDYIASNGDEGFVFLIQDPNDVWRVFGDTGNQPPMGLTLEDSTGDTNEDTYYYVFSGPVNFPARTIDSAYISTIV